MFFRHALGGRAKLVFLAVVSALAAAIPGIQAASVYWVSGNVVLNATPEDEYESSHGIIAEGDAEYYSSNSEITAQASGHSEASFYGLHADASSNITKHIVSGATTFYILSGGGSARGTWDDFYISGPAGGTVQVSLNLYLDGSFVSTTSGVPALHNSATASASVSVFVNGSFASSGQYTSSSSNGSLPATIETGGMLVGFDGNGLVTTAVFNAPVGEAFTLELNLSASAGTAITYQNPALAIARTDFSNTLTFNPDGDVFNLPDGYTINSAGAGIVDNAYVIPEPTPVALLGTLLALGLLRRRSRQPV